MTINSSQKCRCKEHAYPGATGLEAMNNGDFESPTVGRRYRTILFIDKIPLSGKGVYFRYSKTVTLTNPLESSQLITRIRLLASMCPATMMIKLVSELRFPKWSAFHLRLIIFIPTTQSLSNKIFLKNAPTHLKAHTGYRFQFFGNRLFANDTPRLIQWDVRPASCTHPHLWCWFLLFITTAFPHVTCLRS